MKKPVLLIGPSGSGKTGFVNHVIACAYRDVLKTTYETFSKIFQDSPRRSITPHELTIVDECPSLPEAIDLCAEIDEANPGLFVFCIQYFEPIVDDRFKVIFLNFKRMQL